MTKRTSGELTTDIATLDDGGAATAAEVRSVLTNLRDSMTLLTGSGLIEAGHFHAFDNDGTPAAAATYTPNVSTGSYKLITNEEDFTIAVPGINPGQAVAVWVKVINGTTPGTITFAAGFFIHPNSDSISAVAGEEFIIAMTLYNISGTITALVQIAAQQ